MRSIGLTRWPVRGTNGRVRPAGLLYFAAVPQRLRTASAPDCFPLLSHVLRMSRVLLGRG